MSKYDEDVIAKHLDGGYGWIVLIACTIIHSSLPPLMQCFGIIYKHHFEDMGITAVEISFLLHLNSSVMCSLGFFSGPMLKKYNYRQTSLFGCLLVCSGIIITTFTKTYGQLIFPICILIGAGQSILMPSTALAINSYFRKRLTLAMSLTITAGAAFPIVVPHICNYLLNLYGVSGTILLLGAISFHSFAGALLLHPVKVHKPLKNSNRSNQSETLLSSCSDTPSGHSIYKRLLAIFDIELFQNRTYVVIIIGMSISYVAELNFTLMSPFVLAELAGFTRQDIAFAMSMQAVADICGRLFIPVLSQKFRCSSKVMYACTIAGFSLGRTVMVCRKELRQYFKH